MKVGFDISQFAHPGGVANYTQNLAQELVKVSGLEMVFFYSSLRKPYRGVLPNVKPFPLPPTLFEFLFNKVRLVPIERFIGDVDLFHSSDWIEPPTKAKKVTTYHDVVPLKFPQWSHPKIVEVHRRRLALVEKEVDMVIAVSETTKRDLLEISKIPKEKVVVIYEAAGGQFKPQLKQEIEKFKKNLGLPDEFVLAIGGAGERRNLNNIREATKNYNLVITGETIPYVSDDEMPLLYSAAQALIYTSFYEGFGLPILEAMACGTPVITSDVSAMLEVGGDAAVYASPDDIGDIAGQLNVLLADEDFREKVIARGLKQAAKFSWEKCAKETFDTYRSVVDSK